jgi:glutamate-5-semialdehyde dehydrogenase
MSMDLRKALAETREASRHLVTETDQRFAKVLETLAALTRQHADEILAANRLDLERMDPADPKYDRLLLDESRLESICKDLEKVAGLESPLGRELQHRTLDNGLELRQVSVPLGVVAVIFESRPNVTFDVFALCLATFQRRSPVWRRPSVKRCLRCSRRSSSSMSPFLAVARV